MLAPSGTCLSDFAVGQNGGRRIEPGECDVPHPAEVVHHFVGAEHFPSGYPTSEERDSFTASSCATAALLYIGVDVTQPEEALRQDFERMITEDGLVPVAAFPSQETWSPEADAITCVVAAVDGEMAPGTVRQLRDTSS